MAREARRPNAVVVLTDQQRWDTCGVHGNPLGVTPVFDRMARAGTLAECAITPNPVCAPARAALQTGRWPTAVGVHRNDRVPRADVPTLAGLFDAAGYATGYLGKWHLADRDPVPPGQRGGYRHWLASNTLEFTSDAYRTVLHDSDGRPVFLPGYRSDAVFDAAIRFAAEHRGEPFLLFVSLIEPHHQNEVDAYPAPDGAAERFAGGGWLPPDLAALESAGGSAHRHLPGYLGQIERVDQGLGRLLDALRSLEILDDTVLAYTADHGSHFKTRNAEYKRSCHDSSVRVPLALRGPGFDGGRVLRGPVSTLDLPPTLLQAAGIPVPDGMHGRSLLEPRDAAAAEAYVQISEAECGRALRTDRWKYHVAAPEARHAGEPWAPRYVEASLYDLAHDPYELDNLIGLSSHREVADGLRGRLLARIAAAGEPPAEIVPAPPRAPGQRRVDPQAWDAPLDGLGLGHRAAF
ncbi:arylsulfatase [Mangrovactinospora gilvigrisea]|uniref:Arylsulfatase n=1 Tax=Mangrovactinospora gilvigrisea TaxID=1428644 RepID=A0A1J7B9N2_9ACTN|nr:sulfatase-like hydrolase/transferase [Mangrovactinospora gilvigrisea]OIV35318.1 arylsulfatase [Mangrovactinospora gilvigrisea]